MDMKKASLAALVALCLLLSGCTGWMNGSYSSVHPFTDRGQQNNEQIVSVSSYSQLRETLADLVERSGESMLLNVQKLDQTRLAEDMQKAVSYVLENTPIGAYAVESITYEQGTRAGQDVLFVTAEYNHNRPEILRMKRARSMEDVKKIVSTTMDQCEARVVLVAENYFNLDLAQFVKNYAVENPDIIMEVPQVTVNMYPSREVPVCWRSCFPIRPTVIICVICSPGSVRCLPPRSCMSAVIMRTRKNTRSCTLSLWNAMSTPLRHPLPPATAYWFTVWVTAGPLLRFTRPCAAGQA